MPRRAKSTTAKKPSAGRKTKSTSRSVAKSPSARPGRPSRESPAASRSSFLPLTLQKAQKRLQAADNKRNRSEDKLREAKSRLSVARKKARETRRATDYNAVDRWIDRVDVLREQKNAAVEDYFEAKSQVRISRGWQKIGERLDLLDRRVDKKEDVLEEEIENRLERAVEKFRIRKEKELKKQSAMKLKAFVREINQKKESIEADFLKQQKENSKASSEKVRRGRPPKATLESEKESKNPKHGKKPKESPIKKIRKKPNQKNPKKARKKVGRIK